jgi:NhaP-type Na+/H+ or K+/H+ antiporter
MAIQLVYLQDHLNLKERIFMALNCTKGIAVAVVAFILSNHIIKIPESLISLMVLFILYSIILSSVMARFSQKFIRLKVEE